MSSVPITIDPNENVAGPARDMSAVDPVRVIEALLFAGGSAVTAGGLVQATGLEEESVVESIAQLNQQYFREGRPYEIRRVDQAYHMILRPSFASVLRRLHGRSREVRLSIAAIEVLSLVAYQQPVKLQAIDAIRGVDSAAIVRQLRRRDLIELAEPSDDTDRAERFRTTKRFLRLFHLSTLDDLPRVQELEKS